MKYSGQNKGFTQKKTETFDLCSVFLHYFILVFEERALVLSFVFINASLLA